MAEGIEGTTQTTRVVLHKHPCGSTRVPLLARAAGAVLQSETQQGIRSLQTQLPAHISAVVLHCPVVNGQSGG